MQLEQCNQFYDLRRGAKIVHAGYRLQDQHSVCNYQASHTIYLVNPFHDFILILRITINTTLHHLKSRYQCGTNRTFYCTAIYTIYVHQWNTCAKQHSLCHICTYASKHTLHILDLHTIIYSLDRSKHARPVYALQMNKCYAAPGTAVV